MDSFDQILKSVIGSEKLDNVPALFSVETLQPLIITLNQIISEL